MTLSFCGLSAQDSIEVKGKFVGNTKYAKVIMLQFGVGTYPVGAVAIKHDSFNIKLPKSIEPGIYRFQYSMAESQQYIDLIINGSEKLIAFSLKANESNAWPDFTASTENKLWFEYRLKVNKRLEKIDLLNQFINGYPNKNAEVVKAAYIEWQSEQNAYKQDLEQFKLEAKGTWAYEMGVNQTYYFTDPFDDLRVQDYMRRDHFWDGFNATNPELINTPLYTEHILNYLRYWMNPNMNFSPTEKTEGFKRAVDVIIRQFADNEKTHEFAFKYLSLGFKEIGEEEVLQYLDENYKDLANRCFDAYEKTEFDKRMQGYAALKTGNLAPDFKVMLYGTKQKFDRLYKLKAQKTLLVFWSSSCPHCMQEMPKLNTWASSNPNVKVIAIGLDTDSVAYFATIASFKSLIHTCDFKGWDTEAAASYFIAATPTFILLDEKKQIIGKYSSVESVIGE